MMGANNQPAGFFAITKTKVIVVVSLAITWWLALLLPHYTPMIQEQFHSRIDDARHKIPNIKVDWKTVEHPHSAYNASKVAVIVEHRPIPHLVPQILHMIKVIPSDWRMIFIGSDKSVVSLSRAYAIKNQQVIGKLDLLVLPAPWEIDSKEKVHRLWTDMRFYDEFLPGAEWILKFEHDSILCANSETSLNEWLDWSWAGAPRTPDDRFAGNGGLTLRRVSAVKRILPFQQRHNDSSPEDEWFGTRLVALPNEKVASGVNGVLTVEDVYIDKPMGFHVRDGGNNLADDVWKDEIRRKKILEYCPELSLIMDMKLERERCKGDNKQGELNPVEDPDKAAEAAKKKADEAAKKQEAEKKKAEEEAKKKEADKKKAEEDAKKDAASKTEGTTKATAKATAAETLLRASSSASPSPSPTPEKATLQGLD